MRIASNWPLLKFIGIPKGETRILSSVYRCFTKILKWCQRRDLNPRPKAYESSALPLSYSGNPDKMANSDLDRVPLHRETVTVCREFGKF